MNWYWEKCIFQIDWWYVYRPGWERRAIELSCPRTRHVKNPRVVCCTQETFYGVFSQLFLIHSFSTLIIILFLISLIKLLYSTFHLLFMQLLHVKHIYTQLKSYYVQCFTSVSFVCIRNTKYRRCYDFIDQFFKTVILLNYKKPDWFYFL